MCGTGDEVSGEEGDEKPLDMEATLTDKTLDEPLPNDDEEAQEGSYEATPDSAEPDHDPVELGGPESPQPKETLVPEEEENGLEDDEALFQESPGYLPLEEIPEEPEETVEQSEGVLLKQDGKVYHVRNMATIQRWIVERRVVREDLVSSGGLNWEPVGQHPDLGVFFQMVERLDDLEHRGHDLHPAIESASLEPLVVVPEEVPEEEPEESPELLEEEGPGLLSEVSVDEDELDPEPSDVGVSIEYTGEQEDEAWRDAPSRDIRGEKPITLQASDELGHHPLLSPLQEVMATEEVSVEIPAPDPVPPEPEDQGITDLDEDFRKHFDADGSELAWVEDRSSRRLQMVVAATVLLLVFGGLAWWSNQEPQGSSSPPPSTLGEQGPAELQPEPPSDPPSEQDAVDPDPPEPDPPEPDPPPDPPAEPQVVQAEPAEDVAKPKPKPKPQVSGAAALTKKGWNALGQGDVRKARGYFVEAVAAEPTLADAHYGLGYTAATQQDRPTAIRHYCKALEHGRGNLDIERDVPPLLKQIDGSCQ